MSYKERVQGGGGGVERGKAALGKVGLPQGWDCLVYLRQPQAPATLIIF